MSHIINISRVPCSTSGSSYRLINTSQIYILANQGKGHLTGCSTVDIVDQMAVLTSLESTVNSPSSGTRFARIQGYQDRSVLSKQLHGIYAPPAPMSKRCEAFKHMYKDIIQVIKIDETGLPSDQYKLVYLVSEHSQCEDKSYRLQHRRYGRLDGDINFPLKSTKYSPT